MTNKLLNAINVALALGYDSCGFGVYDAGNGAKVSDIFWVNSEELIHGEFLWIIVEEKDLYYFKANTKPDRDYAFGDVNQRIYLYFA